MRVTLFSLVLLLSLCNSAFSGHIKDEWRQWKKKYGKKFSEEEDDTRFKIWKSNHKIVERHNLLFQNGNSTYKMGMNAFAAMTEEEFKALLLPRPEPKHFVQPTAAEKATFSNILSVPESVDWRKSGYVTGVKNQGDLGTCYSFSAVQAIEGQYSKQTGSLISLSEQQVVDCNQGGDGGYPRRVYRYIMGAGGSMTEASYPYVDKIGKCQFDQSKVAATVESYKFVSPLGNEKSMKIALSQIGPISVSSIKIFMSFQLYESGVYYEPKCTDPSLDGQGYHAMLATGYGTENGQDYWMVKNSWGTGWGEDGYIKMIRNKDNNCGIASEPTYPIMSKTQPRNYASAIESTTTGQGNALLSSLSVVILCLLPTLYLQSY